MLTRQEIFSKVFNYFIVEGHPASVHGTICKYRYGNDQKCAIGCLIPDELYDPEIEGVNGGAYTTIACLEGRAKKLEEIYKKIGIPIETQDDRQFLVDLQKCHDYAGYDKSWLSINNPGATFNQKMEIMLVDFAKMYGLSIPGTEK